MKPILAFVLLAHAPALAQPGEAPAPDAAPGEPPEASTTVEAPPSATPTSPPEAEPIAIESVSLEQLLEPTYFDASLRKLVQVGGKSRASLYGFTRANVQRQFRVPSVDASGKTRFANDPLEWSAPNFHLYGDVQISDRASARFNLFGSGSDVELRNAYGNIELAPALQVRAGLMYRRFGLYNEKLDQFPVFLGIEPPELFDKDHLMLPRTTMFAVHGMHDLGDYSLQYFVDTDNGEGGAAPGVYPLGWDLRIKGESLIVGTSGYLSSLGSGKTTSTVAVGDGSPSGGVMPWMAGDKYVVYGGFLEYAWKRAIVQAAYWRASHEADRDPASVLAVVRDAGITDGQRRRFLGANAGKADADLGESDVVVAADYAVQTFYVRVGYSLTTALGELTPYAFIDWMAHSEAIDNKTYGGDNEAGFADDGKFWKPSVGLVLKPITHLAIKLDGSVHVQKFNSATELYPEVRLDVSFAFKLLE